MIWCEEDVILRLKGCYGTCMRRCNSYLERQEVPATAARRVSEGHLAKIKCWYWRADTARGKLISSRKQIIRDTERLRINLPRKINWWGEIWTWQKSWLKSRCWCVVLGAFLVEENYQGFYLVGQPSEISRNYVLWCLVCRDLSLEDFWKLNFSSFSTEAVETRYFRELLVRNNKYHTCKEFF